MSDSTNCLLSLSPHMKKKCFCVFFLVGFWSLPPCLLLSLRYFSFWKNDFCLDGGIFAIGRGTAIRLLLWLFNGRRDGLSISVFGSVRSGQLKIQILVASLEWTFFAFLLLDDLAGILLVDSRLWLAFAYSPTST